MSLGGGIERQIMPKEIFNRGLMMGGPMTMGMLAIYKAKLEEEIRAMGGVSPMAEYRISGEVMKAADDADPDGGLWDEVLEGLGDVRAEVAEKNGLEEDDSGEYPFVWSLKAEE